MSNEVMISEAKSVPMFPSQVEWGMLKEQATLIVKTGFLPIAIKTPEQAIAVALKGRELGIPLMQAFAHVHIITGKPAISAELMLALIFKNCPGAVINYIETSDRACVIEAKRPGGKPSRFEFTIEDARKADLMAKDTWKKYAGAMLRARTVSIVARALFPDAIMGCSYTPEELGAEVNEDGEVLNIPTEKPRNETKAEPIEVTSEPVAMPTESQPQSDYIITFGKFKGKTLAEVKLGDVESYIDWLKQTAAKSNKPISPQGAELMRQVEMFRAQKQDAVMEESPMQWEEQS